jgi:hypothetical protein
MQLISDTDTAVENLASPCERILIFYPIKGGHNQRNYDHPEKLKPVKEGNTDECWLLIVVERWEKQEHKRDSQEDQPPGFFRVLCVRPHMFFLSV